MVSDERKVTKRLDYKPTPFAINKVNLDFNLGEDVTIVTSTLAVKPRTEGETAAMVLDGSNHMKLVSISIDDVDLIDEVNYVITEKTLTIKQPPSTAFTLKVVTHINPEDNKALEGLYKSSGNFCSQCEAEGFRRITFFYDRPDVMATYRVRIEADKATCPVLLSNGNLVKQEELPAGRHSAVWEDPWPKPCYLFALVAGDLAMQEGSFMTMSGKDVTLRIYTESKNISKVDFAMASLIRAMKWDEDRFGLEYDLDLFNIVAVDDFTMGAMENKSLNVFNSRLILALPETATDNDFQRIEGVVGHEYFHNWTGNRVTCRDWFQLTLKEGLTVFRDSEFTSDMNSRPVKRIQDVKMIRTAQFGQDSGPMAHPIRCDEFVKVDNFYTVTVYRKGCEIIRLYDTILGTAGFRKGMDLYFKRHDGHAVTCDDFLAAMGDANDEDLSSLGQWYSQAGTPCVQIAGEYDAAAETYTLTVQQQTPPTPGQPTKLPVLIPITTCLLGPNGQELEFQVAEGNAKMSERTATLLCDQATSVFVLSGVSSKPTPSLLRNFSAPVHLNIEGQTEDDLAFLLQHDSDPFNRWDAGQRLAINLLRKLYEATGNCADAAAIEVKLNEMSSAADPLVKALRGVLLDKTLDGSMAAMTLTLPTQTELVQTIPGEDPIRVHRVRSWVIKTIAQRLTPELEAVFQANEIPASTPYTPDSKSAAKRAYRNTALALLCASGNASYPKEALALSRAATNMTDASAAVEAVVNINCDERTIVLAEFYEKWAAEPLVVLKWLTMQAMSNKEGNLVAIKALVDHPAFIITNPNSCYSLILAFASSAVNYHATDGSGYEFMSSMVLTVDGINPQVAARVASCFTTVKQLDSSRQTLIFAQLQRIIEHPGLSANVFEIVSKSLAP